jgi:hypothetical protein
LAIGNLAIALERAVRVVNRAQQLVEMGSFLDGPNVRERPPKRIRVGLREQPHRNDPLIWHNNSR